MTERLLFNSFVEAAIVKPYAGRLTPRLKDRLRQHQLDLDAKLRPGYSAGLLAHWLEAMAEELYRDVPRAMALEAMGRRFIVGWKETLTGRAVMQLVKLLPAKRALGRLERNFRATDNFTRIDFTDLGPTAMRLAFHDVCGVPDYFFGLLDEGATISSAKNPRCRLETLEGAGAHFICEWDA